MPYPGPLPVLLPDLAGALVIFFTSVIGSVVGAAFCPCCLACPFPPARVGVLLLLVGPGGLGGTGDTLSELEDPLGGLYELDAVGDPVEQCLVPVEGLDELEELDEPVCVLDELDEPRGPVGGLAWSVAWLRGGLAGTP